MVLGYRANKKSVGWCCEYLFFYYLSFIRFLFFDSFIFSFEIFYWGVYFRFFDSFYGFKFGVLLKILVFGSLVFRGWGVLSVIILGVVFFVGF